MSAHLGIGLLLGISAGLAPGPLLALVLSETLRHGVGSGIKVALAPLLSDLPIICLALVLATRLSGFQAGLGVVSLLGGLFILFTGYQGLRMQPQAPELQPNEGDRALFNGVLANLLNPHPYLFWISVGVPTMSSALAAGIAALAGFLGGFYGALVGSKVLLALLVGRSRSVLAGRPYRMTQRLLGLFLCGFALLLFRDGLRLLGFW